MSPWRKTVTQRRPSSLKAIPSGPRIPGWVKSGSRTLANILALADHGAVLDPVAVDVAGECLVDVEEPVRAEGEAVRELDPAIEEGRLAGGGVEPDQPAVERQVFPVFADLVGDDVGQQVARRGGPSR